MSKHKGARKVSGKRPKTRPRRNTAGKKARKRTQTRGSAKSRQKRPVIKRSTIKRMKHAPRLLLEERLGRLVFKLATRGSGFAADTVVRLRCTAEFKLDCCTGMSNEDKTWEAVLVGLKQNL